MRPKNKLERQNKGNVKGKRRAKGLNNYFVGYLTDAFDDDCKRLRNTTKMCSSYCCGNQRKWFNEKTMQEKRHEERSSHDLKFV